MNYQLLENMGLAGMDLSILLIIMLIAIVISWVIAIIALLKYRGLHKKYKKFMGGNEAKALESYITELIELNNDNAERIEQNEQEIKNIYNKKKLDFQKMGMVKYDAFNEMGGNLSFALAVLDENNNGFLINSVHNIQSTYCYAKEIVNGVSAINLSKEEEAALQKALTSNRS